MCVTTSSCLVNFLAGQKFSQPSARGLPWQPFSPLKTGRPVGNHVLGKKNTGYGAPQNALRQITAWGTLTATLVLTNTDLVLFVFQMWMNSAHCTDTVRRNSDGETHEHACAHIQPFTQTHEHACAHIQPFTQTQACAYTHTYNLQLCIQTHKHRHKYIQPCT